MLAQRHHAFRFTRWVRRLLIGLACALLGAVIALLIWARQTAAADPAARFALDSDDAVIVSRNEALIFRPRDTDPSVGLVFYPGGKAEPAAYAPILRNLAAQGYLVVMPRMPLNLALLAPGRALRLTPRFPEIRHWVIAGHSLGGVMAAELADAYPAAIAGVVLWASYPAGFTDLSDSSLPVLSVHGTADALTTAAKVEHARARLPAATRFVRIEGGDHWNFGNFAHDSGSATISRDEQQAAILEATAAFLASIAPEENPD
jgi:pimeloyl-ACP methyl ester carboxylesterase